jgi:hypothetical protein
MIIGVPLHNLSILNFLAVPEIRLFTKPGRRVSQLCALGTMEPIFHVSNQSYPVI